MNTPHTHYDNLKVARNAPSEVIRAAYKSLAQKYHPDKHPNSQEAERIIKIINNAYEVLMDAEKRAKYDIEIARSEQATQPVSVTAAPAPTKPAQNTSAHTIRDEISSENESLPTNRFQWSFPIMAVYSLIGLCIGGLIFVAFYQPSVPTASASINTPSLQNPKQVDTANSAVTLNNALQTHSPNANYNASITLNSSLTQPIVSHPNAPAVDMAKSSNAQVMRGSSNNPAQSQVNSPSLEYAEKLYKSARYVEADLIVDTLLTESPNHPPTWKLKGLLQASRGNIPKATQAFGMYLKSSNNSDDAIQTLSNISQGQGGVSINIKTATGQALRNIGR